MRSNTHSYRNWGEGLGDDPSYPAANLWEGKVHLLDGLGHAPFWEAPGQFDPILARFLGDVLD